MKTIFVQKMIAVLVILLTITACQRDQEINIDERQGAPCGDAVQINAPNYSTDDSDKFMVIEAAISGDCLTVKLGLSSGCAVPETMLLHSLGDSKIFPQQQLLKVVIPRRTGCAMPGVMSFKYDLFPLRLKNTRKLSITLDGYDKNLEYRY